ncbi:hypothetical protein AAG906_007105 [Vitis piasezkii]
MQFRDFHAPTAAAAASSATTASVPYLDSAFDLATICLISALLLLSLLSLFFVFHLRLKCRTSHQLQNFNSLWTVRLLLVLFISFWAVNELLRIPFFRRRYPYPFLPALTLAQQAGLCKVHVVLSLGLYEPGFLVTFLFLVNVSVKKHSRDNKWGVVIVFALCLPIFLLQLFFTYFSPPEVPIPGFLKRSFMTIKDEYGNDAVLCMYPLVNTLVFCAFAIVYAVCFLLSCWRVVSLVINKGLRVRIYALASAVLFPLLVQLLFLGISVVFSPADTFYGGAALMVFLSVLCCTVVGESILIIRPITEALSAGGDCCLWIRDVGPGKQVADEG